VSDGWRVEERNDGPRLALAVVAALALVAVGLVIRSRLGGDDDGGPGGDDLTLTCPDELADVCEEAVGDDMTVRRQAPSDTATALTEAASADDVDPGLWLVPRPWAEAVAADRERSGGGAGGGGGGDGAAAHVDDDEAVVGEPVGPIARSPVVIVAYEERAAALEAGGCGGPVTLRCLGDVAGEAWADVGGETAWGTVRTGIADPASASGLVVLGDAVGSYLDLDDYATNDLDDPTLSGWLRDLGRTPAAAGAGAVTRMVTRGPGELSLLATVEADGRTAAGREGLQVLVPEPIATADLVVVPVGDVGDAADRLAGDDALLDALATAGWRTEGRELPDGLDADLRLPDGAGVPRGEVLRAALTRWLDAT
jgi:hypothetical protein